MNIVKQNECTAAPMCGTDCHPLAGSAIFDVLKAPHRLLRASQRLLVGHIAASAEGLSKSENAALEQQCDLVIARFEHGALVADLAVATGWMMLWHRDYRACLTAQGDLWFVPDDGSQPLFTITDGRLDAHMDLPCAGGLNRADGLARAACAAIWEVL